MLTIFICCAWAAVIGVIAVLVAFMIWVVSESDETEGMEVEAVLDDLTDEAEQSKGE